MEHSSILKPIQIAYHRWNTEMLSHKHDGRTATRRISGFEVPLLQYHSTLCSSWCLILSQHITIITNNSNKIYSIQFSITPHGRRSLHKPFQEITRLYFLHKNECCCKYAAIFLQNFFSLLCYMNVHTL